MSVVKVRYSDRYGDGGVVDVEFFNRRRVDDIFLVRIFGGEVRIFNLCVYDCVVLFYVDF